MATAPSTTTVTGTVGPRPQLVSHEQVEADLDAALAEQPPQASLRARLAASWAVWRRKRALGKKYGREVGPPVDAAEVKLSKNPGCKTCFGTGEVQGDPLRLPDGSVAPRLCQKCLRRFVRAYSQELIQVGDRLFWKKKRPLPLWRRLKGEKQPLTPGDVARVAAKLEG